MGGAEAVPGGKIWKDLEVRQVGKCYARQCRASDPKRLMEEARKEAGGMKSRPAHDLV